MVFQPCPARDLGQRGEEGVAAQPGGDPARPTSGPARSDYVSGIDHQFAGHRYEYLQDQLFANRGDQVAFFGPTELPMRYPGTLGVGPHPDRRYPVILAPGENAADYVRGGG